MSALVGYDNSDEEDFGNESQPEASDLGETESPRSQPPITNGTSIASKAHSSPPSESNRPRLSPSANESKQGPSLGPTVPATKFSDTNIPSSINRSLIHHLTLPIHANLNIPPSPPALPSSGLDLKISHFLYLKSQGIHFNAKLAANSALKNPSLVAELRDSAGLNGDGGQVQYVSTLVRDLWDPYSFPENVYKWHLLKTQRRIEKRKVEELKGAPREFVSAKAEKVEVEAGLQAVERESAAERVMAGLERRSAERDRSTKRHRT